MIDQRTILLAQVAQWLTVSAAVLAVAFVVMYARVTFEHTREGRHKMREHAFLAGALGTTVAGHFNLLPIGVLVGLALVFLIALNGELINLIVIFRRAQRDHGAEKGE